MGRIGLAFLTFAVLGISGCMSDKAANSETPMEAARYPALEAHLENAFAELCGLFDDALAARFVTDTALIPGIEWPFEMPPRRRDGTTNFVDENTSWGVGYNRPVDTTRYVAFWDLGRLVDTGVIAHTSPIVATRVEHELQYGRIDGFGDEAVSWDAILDVTMSELDAETAQLSASLDGSHQIPEQCSGLACDVIEIVVSNGQFGKVGGQLDLATLSGTVTGTMKLTEFDVLLGHDAIFTWELSGTISNGVATVTASSGNFQASGTYALCP
jgi:hypothetical protein